MAWWRWEALLAAVLERRHDSVLGGVEQGAVMLRAPAAIAAWGATMVARKAAMARWLGSVAWPGGTHERQWCSWAA